MSTPNIARRPLGQLASALGKRNTAKTFTQQARHISSTPARRTILGVFQNEDRMSSEHFLDARLDKRTSKWFAQHPNPQPKTLRTPIKVYPPPPSTRSSCPTPLTTLTQSQLSTLDPTGARTRLFSPSNPEAAHVGDILLVRLKSGDPYAGTCINIRRAGIDTAVLLRNQLTRVGVEMWYKIYSPNVEGIEVVQRAKKRARRARLYYMRQEKHDPGSVQNVVTMYVRQRQVLRSGAEGKKGEGVSGKKKGKKGKK